MAVTEPEILTLTFTSLHEAWYRNSWVSADRIVAEIAIGLSSSLGGSEWEFVIDWRKFDNQDRLTPRLAIFHDAWQAFLDPRIQGLFATLADLKDSEIQPDEFKQLLLDQGFEDTTPYESPYKERKAERFDLELSDRRVQAVYRDLEGHHQCVTDNQGACPTCAEDAKIAVAALINAKVIDEG